MSLNLPLGSGYVRTIYLFLCLTSLAANMSAATPDTHEAHARLNAPFTVPSAIPWTSTGIQLKKGQTCCIKAEASDDYRDKTLPCDANGPLGPLGWLVDKIGRRPGFLNPLRYTRKLGVTKELRVLRDGTTEKRRASFLTLIATIGQCDSKAHTITIGSGREFIVPEDGELYLFPNDWPGGSEKSGPYRFTDRKTGVRTTYGNNQGQLTVTVTILPSSPR